MFSFGRLGFAALALVLSPALSLAQPLGTFRWQVQPYCNILSIAVVQQGGLYLLNGNDDQCGAPQQASVVGLAFQNPDGTIGFGLTVVTAPGGSPVHIDATISIATLGGTWRDSNGNNGTFVFTPGPGIGGSPRPALSTPRAAFVDGNQSLVLTPADQTIRTLSLTAPTTGTMIVSASGYFDFNGATADSARCTITTGSIIDLNHLIIADDNGVPASTAFVPFARTRGFTVTPGAFTVNLVCDLFTGSVDINDTSLTAIFIAGP
jgi:hypothetical protein